jgi:sarcosine oxidase subunit alpha
MSETINLTVNGEAVTVVRGTSVLVALVNAGILTCRTSVSGETRGGLCGMGVCFECRTTIDGVKHRRACETLCAEGMQVVADV